MGYAPDSYIFTGGNLRADNPQPQLPCVADDANFNRDRQIYTLRFGTGTNGDFVSACVRNDVGTTSGQLYFAAGVIDSMSGNSYAWENNTLRRAGSVNLTELWPATLADQRRRNETISRFFFNNLSERMFRGEILWHAEFCEALNVTQLTEIRDAGCNLLNEPLPPPLLDDWLDCDLTAKPCGAATCRRDGSWYLEPQGSSSCYAAFHSGADPSEPPITASTSTSTPVVLGGDVTLSVIELIISNSSSSIGGPNASQVARIQIEGVLTIPDEGIEVRVVVSELPPVGGSTQVALLSASGGVQGNGSVSFAIDSSNVALGQCEELEASEVDGEREQGRLSVLLTRTSNPQAAACVGSDGGGGGKKSGFQWWWAVAPAVAVCCACGCVCVFIIVALLVGGIKKYGRHVRTSAR